MKKLGLMLLLGLFLVSCGAMYDSEFLIHDTMYKNWDHMQYSQGGSWDPTDKTGKQSQEQGWWGIEVPHTQ